MEKIILLICIVLLVLGEFLEQWERKNPRIFWTGILLLAITFSSFDEVQFQTPTIVEKNRASILAINPGGEGSKDPTLFLLVPSKPEVPPMNPSGNGGSQRPDQKPSYPWGIDPSYKPGGGGGGSDGPSSSETALSANKIPENDQWVDDSNLWDKNQPNDGSKETEGEEIKEPDKLKSTISPLSQDEREQLVKNNQIKNRINDPTDNIVTVQNPRTGEKVYASERTLRDKVYHVDEFQTDPIPNQLPGPELASLRAMEYHDRLAYLRDRTNCPSEIVTDYMNHSLGNILAPDTIAVPGCEIGRDPKAQRTGTAYIRKASPTEYEVTLVEGDKVIDHFSIKPYKLKKIIKDGWKFFTGKS